MQQQQYRPELLRESDRYRGRRRAPTPPRGRYAAVLTTAVVGAGIVAFAAGFGLDDNKENSGTLVNDASALAEATRQRDLAANKPGRDERTLTSSVNQAPDDAWVLPFRDFRVTSGFGMRWGRLHAGLDMGGIREGTPIYAMHEGTVVLARWNGGYGNNVVIDHGNGLTTVYGHGSRIIAKEGQKVKAGDLILLAGNTGHSFGTHLHLEIRINDRPVDPRPFFAERGIDFDLEIDNVFGAN